jgi:hypothetical protein
MPITLPQILETAEVALAEQNVELAALRARQMLAVTANSSTGTGNIDATFGRDRRFRLVFVRCHFAGTAGAAALVISLDSGSGSSYDARLYTIVKAGVSRDVHFRLTAEESQEPSAWTFQAADRVRVQWTNPDTGNITWGLEVGLAIAT